MNEEQEKKLNAIYTFIVGNDEMGINGAVDRLKVLEDHKRKQEDLKNKQIGFVGAVSLIFGTLGGYLRTFFGL